MPSHTTTLRRYYHIMNKIRQDKPSMEKLLTYLRENDFEIDKRTVERDKNVLRNVFGQEIEYDQKSDSYWLDEENSTGQADLMKYLEMAITAGMISENLEDAHEQFELIEFDDSRNLSGIEKLEPLLYAAKNCLWIECDHENYNYDTMTPYKAKPYLLKEYRNRWYVIVMREDGEPRTLGIDRLHNLKVTKKSFKRDPEFRPKEQFKDIIGVDGSGKNYERIVITMGPAQGRYLKSLPLHPSQKVLSETEDETQLILYVRPNYELIQELLRLRETIKVLEPQSLVDNIKEILKTALAQYK